MKITLEVNNCGECDLKTQVSFTQRVDPWICIKKKLVLLDLDVIHEDCPYRAMGDEHKSKVVEFKEVFNSIIRLCNMDAGVHGRRKIIRDILDKAVEGFSLLP